jgi:hypothetical protein
MLMRAIITDIIKEKITALRGMSWARCDYRS